MKNKQKVIFFTGASGVGKTTIIKEIKEEYQKYGDKILFSSFDDEERIPDNKEVFEKWKSWEEWQKVSAKNYIKDRVLENKNIDLIILDMQVNIDFIIEGFNEINFENYKILLITCSEEEMKKRLQKRLQPELFNSDMINWIKFLEKQAKEKGISILDTSNITLEQSIREINKII